MQSNDGMQILALQPDSCVMQSNDDMPSWKLTDAHAAGEDHPTAAARLLRAVGDAAAATPLEVACRK